jgi:putative DNA primase/helicase
VTASTLASRSDLEAQGRIIVEQLGGRWSSGSGMCRCPAHDDSSPSLSVRVGDHSLLFKCFAGCDTLDVLRTLRRGGQVSTVGVLITDQPRDAANGNLTGLVTRLWDESRGIRGTMAADYLASRGLVSHSAQLRFHPRVQLGPKADATYHPALLSAVRDESGLVAVHRTFLDPGTRRKAAFDNPKRLLGLPGRGAVRLGTAGRVLGLAEGVETALAATVLHKIPVWAVLGNERFGMIDLPKHVEQVVLLADNDAGGKRAVVLAQDGLQRDGRVLQAMWPPERCNDWADVLVAKRGEGAEQG